MFSTADEAVEWAIVHGRARWTTSTPCALVVVAPLILPTLVEGILAGAGMPMYLPSAMARGDLSVLLQASSSWGALVAMDLHDWSEEAFAQLVSFSHSAKRISILGTAYPEQFLAHHSESWEIHEKKLTRYCTLVRRAEQIDASIISTPHVMCRDAKGAWVEG